MSDKTLDRRRILKGASALGVASALTALAAPGIGLASADASTAVLGTWNETVTLHSNGQSFQTYYTYCPGGGVTGTGQTDLTPATLAGPIHGTWIKTGLGSFRWLAHAFSYDPQGNPNGIWNISFRLSRHRTRRIVLSRPMTNSRAIS